MWKENLVMSIALITGSAGLIGSESARFFHNMGLDIVGVDNNMRKYYFGEEGSTNWNRDLLKSELPNYTHCDIDIRDTEKIEKLFKEYGTQIKIVIHTAAQPSHDWAAKEPHTDFNVNAAGTLNLLESTRHNCPEAVFIFTSTNKVYGDTPNYLPLIEKDLRWELDESHSYSTYGIDENMSIDGCKHSIFGASKVAADIMVQEYGRYFDMKTVSFRGGCLTGPTHSGAKLHGFLSYLVKSAFLGIKYSIFGYKGKQVRDNIHAYDLVSAFWEFFQKPRYGEVYNIGGSRHSNCSILEAIEIINKISGKKLNYEISESNRIGDHIWWISDVRKFRSHYPGWEYKYNCSNIIEEIITTTSQNIQE
jgi:CDP-paratose 2-epimerase